MGLVTVAMFKPDVTHVERSRVIRADAEQIMPHLTDMELWVKWGPWSKLDPDVKWTFSEPASGKGSWYEWSGNEDVGRGKMELTAAYTSSTPKVRKWSTIQVRARIYSVPSRLIGHEVEARLFPNTVEVWYRSERVEVFPRLRGEGAHRLSARHRVVGPQTWCFRELPIPRRPVSNAGVSARI